MTHSKSFYALAAGAVLSGTAMLDAHSQTIDAGFLTRSDRTAPSVLALSSAPLTDRLCARAARSSKQNCPSSVHGGSPLPGAATDFTAGLPHLRLNIILKEMQNVIVSGSGVGSTGLLQEPWTTFKIVSTAADVSLPEATAEPTGLPVPAPGDTWSDIPHANGLFQGIILNGCVGVPATFDLTLDGTIYRPSSSEQLGAIHTSDEVEGHGYYNFKYKIRATDADGNVSDFIFSGDADAYCTSQASFPTESEVEKAKATAAKALATAQRSDFITQADVDRFPGGYPLLVPRVGEVLVQSLRAPDTGKSCQVHKQSIIDKIASDPPVGEGPKWLQITIYECPWGGTCCFGPLDGGCYIMIKKRTPTS